MSDILNMQINYAHTKLIKLSARADFCSKDTQKKVE